MSRIVVFSRSDLSRDPRVKRQLSTLCNSHEVIPVGFNPPVDEFKEAIDISDVVILEIAGKNRIEKIRSLVKAKGLWSAGNMLLGIVSEQWLMALPVIGFHLHTLIETQIVRRSLVRKLRSNKADLILANDLSALAVCVCAKGHSKLLFDAHEFSPEQFPGGQKASVQNRYATWLLKRYLPKCDQITTVSEGIADEYSRVFGIEQPPLIKNARGFESLEPKLTPGEKIRLVHHGAASRHRSIELLIQAMSHLDERFTLDLFLVGSDSQYLNELKSLASDDPRIHFQDPVKFDDIPRVLNGYDCGISLLPPVSFNHEHALPNKFFEFVQGRLCLAVGPSPEMARLVKSYDLGVVTDDFTPQSLATSLSQLNAEKVMRYKENSHRAARELSAEHDMKRLREIVEGVLAE
ncbi:glycosyltransferase [Bremerella sp. T1]|uniref:glycosyltransferase n=1 Tax=Bremerella sp. TYQ1 TaxID=3119568 RepID=UPI001CCFD24F|nr:glycosyltransferase [Bremerella volcania]UBM36335.1 glycosyltransferase [Bremerella volcania]